MKRSMFASLAALSLLVGAAGASALAFPTTPAAPAAHTAQAADPTNYEKIVGDNANAIVALKYSLKAEGGQMGGDQEIPVESFGVMMDAKGLIVGSYRSISPPGATPSKFKVLIGDDNEGVDAKVLNHDTELDLIWLQIEKPADKPYAFVDFSKSAEGKMGDHLVVLDRLNKFFDRVPQVVDVQIGSLTKKPRSLMIPANEMREHVGMPAFNAAGQVVGFICVQVPGEDDVEQTRSMRPRGAVAVLPAADLVSATAKAKDNPPKEEAKPAAPAAPGAAPAAAPGGPAGTPAKPAPAPKPEGK